MDEQYYWIEIKFPLFGFWGTVFKFWEGMKKIKEKIVPKEKLHIIKGRKRNGIRNPT